MNTKLELILGRGTRQFVVLALGAALTFAAGASTAPAAPASLTAPVLPEPAAATPAAIAATPAASPLALAGRQQPHAAQVSGGAAPIGVPAQAWSRIRRQVTAEAYAPAADPQDADRIVAMNPAQRLHATFARDGLSVGASAGTAAGLRLRTLAVGGMPAAAVAPVLAAGRVEYRHAGYTEWFRNEAAGLEQGWILDAAAAQRGERRLELAVDGGTVSEDGVNALRISVGEREYRYAGLQARDASGRELPARLRADGARRIVVAVDDRDARYPLSIDPALTLSKTLTIPGPNGTSEGFTYTAKIDVDTLAVSGYAGNGGKGRVYIFERNQGGAEHWGLVKTVEDPLSPGSASDLFGSRLDLDGDTLVAGGNTNQAYVFNRNTGGAENWGREATIDNPISGETSFPGSLALDHGTLVAGNGSSGTAGRAWVFYRNQGGAGHWGLITALAEGSPGSSDSFGASVAISVDTIVVGAPFAGGTGKASVFLRNQGGADNWGRIAILASPGVTDFGVAVAADADTIAVGAAGIVSPASPGATYLYYRNQGGANGWGGINSSAPGPVASVGDPLSNAGDGFGLSLALQGDNLAVGAPLTNGNRGSAYLYYRNLNGLDGWGKAASLTDPDNIGGDQFGRSLALTGNILAAGAASSKEVLYTIGGGSLQYDLLQDPGNSQDDSYGYRVAASGDTLLIGAIGTNCVNCNPPTPAGRAFIYDRNQGGADHWGLVATLSDPGNSNLDQFGNAVALDGNTAVVGAYSTNNTRGAAYIYYRNRGGANAWGLVQTLIDPNGVVPDGFGISVAVYHDTIAIGAYGVDDAADTAGAVYLYYRNSGGVDNWGGVKTLIDPQAMTFDQFGQGLALDRDTLAVGANDSNSAHPGFVHVYYRNRGGIDNWGKVVSIADPDTTHVDGFGYRLTMDHDTIAVGSPGGFSNGQARPGAIHLFERNSGGVDAWGKVKTLIEPTQNDPNSVDEFGFALSLSGDNLLAGVPFAKEAVLYSRNQGGAENWGMSRQFFDPMLTGATMGEAVALSGSTVALSSPPDFFSSNVPGVVFVQYLTVAPLPPDFPQAGGGDSQVTLNWTAASGADSYEIYQGTSSLGENPVPVQTGITGTTATVTGLTNHTTYYYYVRSVGGNVKSGVSFETSATPVPPPSAPGTLTATAGDGQVALNWGAATDASYYYVYYGTSPGNEPNTVYGGSGTSTTVRGLSNGTTYYFFIRAFDGAGGGPPSNEASAKPTATPAAPTGVTATGGAGKVTLSWNASTGATSYNVYQGTSANMEGATPVKTLAARTTAISGLVNGTTYFFKIAAVNASGTSPLSSEVSGTPMAALIAPSGVVATPGNTKVTLSWNAVASATSYNIYQGTSPGMEGATPVKNLAAQTAAIPGLTNGVTYYFKIAGVNGATVGPQSAEVHATPAPVPTVPKNVVAMAGDGQVTLSWSASTGAVSYNIFQGTVSGGEGTTPVKTGVTSTSTVITGLTNGTTYYFKITATNTSGNSGSSLEVHAVPTTPPAAPTGLMATSGNGQVSLSWTASATATSYNVYRGTSAGGEATTPVATGITGTNTAITGLTNGSTYFFKVAGVNNGVVGAQSNEASAKPLAPPAAPTGVMATPGSGKVTLSWTASSGATSYSVYMGTTAGGEGATPVKTLAATTTAITGLSHGVTYFFTITASNAAGASPASAEVSATAQ